MKSALKEEDYALSAEQYNMLSGGMGDYKAGNFPKPYVNEAAAQIQKQSIALSQYKEDALDQELMNNLMAVDIKNMREKFTKYAAMTKCTTSQLICSLVIIDLDKILRNQDIDLNTLVNP